MVDKTTEGEVIMKFIFSILLIIGVCLLSYYGVWDVLTLTGGWAWFGLLCILYFIGDVLCDIGNWIKKKRHNEDNKED